MKLGFRAKLFLVSLSIVCTVVGGIGLLLELRIRSWAESQIADELERHGRVLAQELANEDVHTQFDLDLEKLARAAQVRITIMDDSGLVWADSQVSKKDMVQLENHISRPEVQEAMAHGVGVSTRYSQTLATPMLYVALPFTMDRSQGFIRISRSIHDIDQAMWTLRMLFAVMGLLGLLGSIILSGIASHVMSRALLSVVQQIQRMSQTGERTRIQVKSKDEIGRLAGSFNQMAEELTKTAAAFASEQSRFADVVHSVSEAIIAVDDKQQLQLINHAAATLLDLNSQDLGCFLEDVIKNGDLHKLVKRAQEGYSERKEVNCGKPEKHLLAYASPLTNHYRGVVVVLQDVTELRRLERMRRDFVANISHELRTPVGIIRANAETLLEGAMNDPVQAQRFLQAQLRNSDRLAALVNDLLQIAHIESGRYQLHWEYLSLHDVVEQSIASFEPKVDEKHLQVINHVPQQLQAYGDLRSLEHIVMNLLDNAVKYTKNNGCIEIFARHSDEQLRIDVCDDGPGIDAEHRSRVFERFYRVDHGRAREVGGTGLGLAIVKHLAEAMGGAVGVDAATPQGTIVWVLLPHPVNLSK